MRHFATISAIMLLLCLQSCDYISSILHDEDVVAQVNGHKLYKSDLAAVVPAAISPEDSIALVRKYMDNWATDIVFYEIAQEQLSKNEQNVDNELEDYRRSLLKYRYEQLYIDQRLDMDVSDEEVRKYYDDNLENFRLRVPIVKATFVRISKTVPEYELVRKKMSSSAEEDMMLLDSLASKCAERYTDYSRQWVDMVTLAHDFGTDYGSLMSQMKDSFIEIDEYDKTNLAYVQSFVKAGSIPPVEYCSTDIKDVIISQRKRALVAALEHDLLEEARKNENYIIFSDKDNKSRSVK